MSSTNKYGISGIFFNCLILSIIFSSCKKFVEVNPPINELTADNVYTTDATAIAVMTGLYASMSTGGGSFAAGVNSISVQSGLSSDELSILEGANPQYISQYQNELSNQTYPIFWGNIYYFIQTVNVALDALPGASQLTPAVRQELLGEAKFMRAFCNFYLVNLYGDIPLVTTSNYQINDTLGKTHKDQVYQQIIADLTDAQKLLPSGYVGADVVSSTSERVRPNKWAAAALLARTYVYVGKYDSAENQASAVIANTGTYNIVNDPDSVFLANSNEAIWQLQPVNSGFNTEDARVFILTSAPDPYSYPFYLNSFLINTFESGDARFTKWVGVDSSSGTKYYYAFKYKDATYGDPVTEYLMVLRLAEQYLIRAEARAMQNNVGGAAGDLNVVRTRAGLPNTTAGDQASLMTAILHERQAELFTEWGHRWLDLKRTSTVNQVMSVVTPIKGGTWSPNWQLYPIPLTDIKADPNLVQNSGY